jgi:hypothetical protein
MRQDTGVDGDAQRISQLCWMFFLKIIDDQDQELEITQDGYRSPIPKKYQWRAWAADPEGITGEDLLAYVNGELFPALKNVAIRPNSHHYSGPLVCSARAYEGRASTRALYAIPESATGISRRRVVTMRLRVSLFHGGPSGL